jgi:3-hydroxybutyrate dehydrogenase
MNRHALVTGGARGIGAAIVERLRADGWLVHSVDIEDADLTTREGNRAVVEAALERFDGRLDAVVANAGFQHVAPVRDFPEDQWERLQALLVTSPFLLAKYAWDALAASGDGRFLVVASVHGLVASPFKAGYVAAKHGVVGLTRAMAIELAADGVTVNALLPGAVASPMLDGLADELGLTPDDVHKRWLHDQLLVEVIPPSDVTGALLWLLSDSARHVTGHCLAVDGGALAR